MKRFLIGILHGLLCFAACAALGLALLLSCDWLYRADVRLLDIPALASLSEESVLENYHAVLDYLTPWHDGPFALRGLSWSAAGAEYFRQLRLSVLLVYIAGLASGVGLILLHGARHRLGQRVWNISGAFSLGLSALAGVLLALDFSGMQHFFCTLLFRDGWQLYQDLDPVVLLFPQSFFVHAAFLVLFVCVAGSLLQFAAAYGSDWAGRHEGTPAEEPAEPVPASAPAHPKPEKPKRGKKEKRPGPEKPQTAEQPPKQVFRRSEQPEFKK